MPWRGGVDGRLQVGRRDHALDAGLERQVLLQPELIAGGVAVPGRQVPARLAVIAGAGHFQMVRGVEVTRPKVVVAAMAAGYRQAADDVEVIAVRVGGEAVLALRDREHVGLDRADAELRFLPGGVHEAELPDGPLAPAGDGLGLFQVNLPGADGRLAEGGGVRLQLGGDTVRAEFTGNGVLVPGQAGLIVEVDAGHVGPGAIDHGLAHHAASAAAGDVGIGPVAFIAQVHLMAAAHHAVGHEIGAGAEEVAVVVLAAVPIKQVEPQAVLTLDEPIFPRGPAPVHKAEATLAQMWIQLQRGNAGSAVNLGLQGVLARTQQPGVQVQVFGAASAGALHGPGRHGKGRRHDAAIGAGESQRQRAGRESLRRAAQHGDVDPLVGLASIPPQGQEHLDFRRSGGAGQGQERGERGEITSRLMRHEEHRQYPLGCGYSGVADRDHCIKLRHNSTRFAVSSLAPRGKSSASRSRWNRSDSRRNACLRSSENWGLSRVCETWTCSALVGISWFLLHRWYNPGLRAFARNAWQEASGAASARR